MDWTSQVQLISDFKLKRIRLLALEKLLELDQSQETGQLLLNKVLMRDLQDSCHEQDGVLFEALARGHCFCSLVDSCDTCRLNLHRVRIESCASER